METKTKSDVRELEEKLIATIQRVLLDELGHEHEEDIEEIVDRFVRGSSLYGITWLAMERCYGPINPLK